MTAMYPPKRLSLRANALSEAARIRMATRSDLRHRAPPAPRHALTWAALD